MSAPGRTIARKGTEAPSPQEDAQLGSATAKPTTRSQGDLTEIPDEEWAVAERRFEVVRRLVDIGRLTHALVEQKAAPLGVSQYRVYEWIRRYRENPTIESRLPKKRGGQAGSAWLEPEVENIIADAITEYYLNSQKQRMRKLIAEVARRHQRDRDRFKANLTKAAGL
jgi:putative transposase